MIRRTMLVGCVVLVSIAGLRNASAQSTTQLLVNKAEALESRGRIDLASRVWRQILALEPDHRQALAGMTRSATALGDKSGAEKYRSRLQRIDPNDPLLNEVSNSSARAVTDSRLAEAARLSQMNQQSKAMEIYREVFGDNPPSGSLTIAYYETLASTDGGWEKAVAGLRRKLKADSENQDYRLSLGRLLTYQPSTRAEGMDLLRPLTVAGPLKPRAELALHQALVWEDGNEKTQSQLKAYLAENPDPQLQPLLEKATQNTNRKVAVEGPDVQLGYKYLKANLLAESETAFRKALSKAPKSGSALSGLGFVAMQKKDFSGALKDFDAAEAVMPPTKELLSAKASATFWLAMQDGANALKEHRFPEAAALFQRALELQPRNPEALEGLAGALIQQGENAAALPHLEALIQIRPDSTSAWHSIVEASLASGGAMAAGSALRRMPSAVTAVLNDDAEHQVLLVSVYREMGKQAEARKSFDRAVAALNARKDAVPDGLQLRIAGLYLSWGSSKDGAAIYQNYLGKHPENLDAWEGLVFAFDLAKDWDSGLHTLTEFPPALREKALNSPAFLRAAAAIYAGSGDSHSSEGLLRHAVDLETEGGQGPSVSTQLQLAQLYLDNHEELKAVAAFSRMSRAFPENQGVWNGLIVSLHQLDRDTEALHVTETLPGNIREMLEDEPGFLTMEAALYSQNGQTELALRVLRRLTEQNFQNGTTTPAETVIQMCWLLLKSGKSPQELLALIRETSARPDLTSQQSDGISSVLATWILQTADEAHAGGNRQRAVAVLRAGAGALPLNVAIRLALAGNFVEAGDTSTALAIYRKAGLKDASATDYLAAIGAATAEHQPKLAEQWLEESLQMFPTDSDLLNFAARSAAARHDYKKANLFWQSALLSMQKKQAAETEVDPPRRQGSRDVAATDDLGILLAPGSATSDKLLPEDARRSNTTEERRRMHTGGLDWLTGPAAGNVRSLKDSAETGRNQVDAIGWLDRKPQKTSLVPAGLPGPLRNISLQVEDYPGFTPVVPGKPSPYQIASVRPVSPVVLPGSEHSAIVADKSDITSNIEAIRDNMAALEGRNTPYLGVDGMVMHRSGDKGFQRMLLQQSDLQTSSVLMNNVRINLVAHAIFMTTPAPDAQSTMSLGLLPAGSTFDAPSASGLGAEIQLSTANFGIRLGSTPRNFLVKNILAGLRYRPGGGPVTLAYDRETVKDSILSYAGVRDPVSQAIWGGIVADSASVSAGFGGEKSGAYFSVGAQRLTGKNVPVNERVDGTVGAYWQIIKTPYGSLNAGSNLFAMHYAKNQGYFSLGQGGYFSPQRFTLLGAPVTWRGRVRNIEYSAAGTVGWQNYSESASAYYPLQAGPSLYYAARASSEPNYAVNLRLGYQFSPNWYMGAFVDGGNARFYTSTTVGFSIRYALKPQVANPEISIPSIPDWRGARPFRF